MAARKKTTKTKTRAEKTAATQKKTGAQDVTHVVALLKRMANAKVREGMARYAIPSDKALGIAVGDLRKLGKQIGRDHTLALTLWNTDIYEARMLATFIADPGALTPAQMERWCKDFDNWAICDTACFHLFDKSPHAFDKAHAWADRSGEQQKRAAFALIASLALHHKEAADAQFLQCLPLIEQASDDDRNFVKKGVSWALRGIGQRKSPALKAAALKLAHKLTASDNATARWVGKDALRDLTKR